MKAGLILLLPLCLAINTVAKAGEVTTAQQCMVCHNLMDDNGAVHQLAFDGSRRELEQEHRCEACHGASAAHAARQLGGPWVMPLFNFEPGAPVNESNQACLDCHEKEMPGLEEKALIFHQAGKANDLSCMRCHGGVAHGLPDWVVEMREAQRKDAEP